MSSCGAVARDRSALGLLTRLIRAALIERVEGVLVMTGPARYEIATQSAAHRDYPAFGGERAGRDKGAPLDAFSVGGSGTVEAVISPNPASDGGLAVVSDDGSTAAPSRVYPSMHLDARLDSEPRGRSVHVVQATRSPMHAERIRRIVRAGATRLILSDTPANGAACTRLCRLLRREFPSIEIVHAEIDCNKFWECRAAPKAELVFEFGNLIHEAIPERTIAYLTALTLDRLVVASMVTPSFDSGFEPAFVDGDVLEAWELEPGAPLTRAVREAFRARGAELPQLIEVDGAALPELGPGAWRWFFSPLALRRMLEALGYTIDLMSYTWEDIAIWIEASK